MRDTKRTIQVVLAALLLAAGAAASEPVGDETWPPEEWRTVAETSRFRATSSYDETLRFLRRLESEMPQLRLSFFGTSAEGRPMPLVIVSGHGEFRPDEARRGGRAIVMIQSGVHAGEIDGKDACLMILRDMALGRHRDLLDKLILLVVPIYNVDGHERVSPYNRPNQNGPVEGMGFRTTADGHDLNRDHVKLCTPEARALIGLFNEWRPHLHVDNHVTDGAEHAWVLTYSWAEAPQAPPSVADWLETHMPAVLAATRKAGHRIGPYVELLDRSDPAKGIVSWVGGPRLATGYYPLRNRPSILVENHAHKPFRERVRANRDFLLALLAEIAREPAKLIEAVRRAEARIVALGRPDASPSEIVLGYEAGQAEETIRFPVCDWSTEESVALGGSVLRYRSGELREIEVPWIHRPEPVSHVSRPRGYLVLPGWPVIEERLAGHGLRVRRLAAPTELEVETMRLSAPSISPRSRPSYQGLTQIEVKVERASELRSFPAGALWIPADQPDFELAAQLLEPDAPDSLVRWGLLSIVMERKEYIDPRRLEELAREMLEEPRTAAEWKRALDDESFAGDRTARWLWWYRRTKYWDETVGLMPAMRLLDPPRFETLPWNHGEAVIGAVKPARVE